MNKRLKTLLRSMLIIGLVAIGVPLATMSAASAHTPNLTKSCAGITVSGSSYEAINTNTLGIRIDGGAWTTKTFAVNDSLTVAVPQDGVVHSYDAYVHTTNANPAYSHDYSGTVGPCGSKHVTVVLWGTTAATCASDGALVPEVEPTGISVIRVPASGTGPGTYDLTFVPATNYVIDGPTTQHLVVLPQLSGDQCASPVQPVSPVVTNPVCTGAGAGSPGSFGMPINGNGIAYSAVGLVVTATADATHKFTSVPDGWSLVDSHHATFTVAYTNPPGYPACLVPLDVPTPPTPTAPTCDTGGTLTVAPSPQVVTTVDGTVVTSPTAFGVGTHTIAYAPAPGYAFPQGAQTSFDVLVKPMTADCPVSPVNPTVTQSVCTGPGTHSDPVVTLADAQGGKISYTYDALSQVVTATPTIGFAFTGLPSGWSLLPNGTATFKVTLVDAGPCLVTETVPTPPSAVAPTCNTDGTLTVAPTDQVTTTVDGTLVTTSTGYGVGTHTIAYAPAPGYAFRQGAQTSFDATVTGATGNCVLAPGDIAASCTNIVPFLSYGVTLPADFTPSGNPTPLTITFLNPGGPDYVVSNLPLSGQVLWPGASATPPLQWPGWQLQPDGSYVQTTGNFAWTRNGVTVRFDVGAATTSTVVVYPASSSICADPPRSVVSPPKLPTLIHGGVQTVNRCGENWFYNLTPVRGGHYLLGTRTLKTGVWIKTGARQVSVRFVADSAAYQVAGAKVFTVRFNNTTACVSPPIVVPDTGISSYSVTTIALAPWARRVVAPNVGTNAAVVPVSASGGQLHLGFNAVNTLYTWNHGVPVCGPMGTTVYFGHAWKKGPGTANPWNRFRNGNVITAGGCKYRVSSVQVWSASHPISHLFQVAGPARVVLFGCLLKDYSKRIVIFAVKVN